MERRSVLAGIPMALTASALSTETGEAGMQRDSDARTERIVDALEQIQNELRLLRTGSTETTPGDLELVRKNQRLYVRATGRFPEFIDVSLDIWEKVYDWLILTRQPTDVVRLGDGRYALRFYQTLIALRPELSGPFVSLGYDSK